MEFVSQGNRILLTFHTDFSNEENGTDIFYKGFQAHYQAVVKDCGQPRSLPNRAFNYTTREGVNTYEARIQYCCHEPFYKMHSNDGTSESERGLYTCTAQGIWKNELVGEKMPRCLPVCGEPIHPVKQRQRIIGSQKAKLGNFPWQAYTNIHGPGGGALLGDRWILTAAHTINPKDHEAQGSPNLDVFLGHVNVEDSTKLSNHPVRRVIIHPDYLQEESHSFEGDIALLELENSVTLGPNLLPICLPDNETLYDPGLIGYVSGFGIMEERISHDLRFVRLPAARRETFEHWLRQKKKKKQNDVFSENIFCAGSPTLKHNVCRGDAGGVFAVRDKKNDRWVATGIVTWGIGCGEGYGFYTNVLKYVDWIKKEMEV
ncbi:LOW QUALITY PROTEIN: complement C1r subcomponent-like [Bos mutus]|uniref:LOW QUALITY PROTEIN: complement C1r subcomponent-like n=1 Tax=Bos mutus TaxID=72004 RepID=UPI0038B6AA3C